MKKNIEPKNLVEVFENIRHSEKGLGVIYSSDKEEFISYKNLYSKCLYVLNDLQAKGLKPRDELVFQLRDNFDFIVVFWACMLGNIVPVPVSVAANDKYKLKLFNIWKKLNNPYLIIASQDLLQLKQFSEKEDHNDMYANIISKSILISDLGKNKINGTIKLPKESDIAFIQFSSGSTSEPKGVILTHNNLLTNIHAILNKSQIKSNEKLLSWMPLTHDMGLIGCHLTILKNDMTGYFMGTELFIRNPILWIKKLYEHRINITASPNFGYKLVSRFFRPESCPDLDLSAVKLIFNGAEPIFPKVCNDFLKLFEPYGLKRSVIYPVYGLAEASLAVTFSNPGSEIKELHVEKQRINLYQKIVERDHPSDSTVSLVEVGMPINNCFVKIVDDESNILEDRAIGRIYIKGDNVTSGYYNNESATKKAIDQEGWLNTGDVGFFRDGNLVITGRMKDVVYLNGNSYFTHEIEQIAEELDEIEFSRVVFCGAYDHQSKGEEIICFLVFKKKLEDFIPLTVQLRKHILRKVGVEISKIIPVNQIPITTSGKKQRYMLKEQYEQGDFKEILNELIEFEKINREAMV